MAISSPSGRSIGVMSWVIPNPRTGLWVLPLVGENGLVNTRYSLLIMELEQRRVMSLFYGEGSPEGASLGDKRDSS